ncbi:hypothetical protein ACJX0J_030001, partial [Zea mays]
SHQHLCYFQACTLPILHYIRYLSLTCTGIYAGGLASVKHLYTMLGINNVWTRVIHMILSRDDIILLAFLSSIVYICLYIHLIEDILDVRLAINLFSHQFHILPVAFLIMNIYDLLQMDIQATTHMHYIYIMRMYIDGWMLHFSHNLRKNLLDTLIEIYGAAPLLFGLFVPSINLYAYMNEYTIILEDDMFLGGGMHGIFVGKVIMSVNLTLRNNFASTKMLTLSGNVMECLHFPYHIKCLFLDYAPTRNATTQQLNMHAHLHQLMHDSYIIYELEKKDRN